MSFNTSTGKYNARSSFNEWLQAQAPGTGSPAWTYSFQQQQTNQPFPLVQVIEFMAPDPGSEYIGMIVAPGNTYPSGNAATEGVRQLMGFKISIQVDASASTTALADLYQIRDQIMYVLRNAGIASDLSGTIAVGAPGILDYQDDSSSPPSTGIIGQVLSDTGAIIERYTEPTEAAPNIHTIELLVRFEWFELN